MRRVLVIAYYFPPMGLSGVQRVAKFVKYLPEHGWQPTVLTIEPAGYYAYDTTLLHEVKQAGVAICRTASWDPTRFFRRHQTIPLPSEPQRRRLSTVSQLLFVPDNKIGWLPHALRAGRRLLKERAFDAIFSSAPPYTAHLIAARLSRQSGVPLVVDFRDDWVGNPRHVYPTPLHRYLNGRLERLGASMGFSIANDHFALRLVTLTENLDAALELFLLSFRDPNLDAGEFDRLKKEQLSGWIAEREESKQIRAQEVYLHQIFRNEPTGYLPDGTAEGIAACRVEDVRAHFARLFTGDEPILAVLTDLSRGEAQERVVERIVQERTAREGTYPWEGFEPKNGSGRRVIIVPDKETNTDEIVFGAFTTCEKDPDWHVHRVITHIFGGDMNSRLFRIVRGDRGLSYGASCWYESAHGRCPRDRIVRCAITRQHHRRKSVCPSLHLVPILSVA